MKTLARNEQETDVAICLGVNKKGYVMLNWRDMNGIIIPGKPGSSKTNTAVWLANQLAAKGIKLVRMDYLADETNAQTFINQTQHLAPADYLPPAIEIEDIEDRITSLYELGMKRRVAGSPENLNQYPIAIFIDEITSLLAVKTKTIEITSTVDLGDGTKERTKQRKRTMLEVMNDIIRMFRKANIKFVVMGQNWQQLGTASGVAAFRSNFNTVLFHRVAPKDVALFEVPDATLQKAIQTLKPGTMIYNRVMIRVPEMAKTPNVKQTAIESLMEYPISYAPHNIAPEYTQETVRLPELAPKLKFKTVKKCSKRYSNTCCLANFLGIKCSDLEDRTKYG